MKLNASRKAVFAILTLMIAIALGATGCSSLRTKKTTSSSTTSTTAKSKTIYYDFGDILLPSQLSVNDNESFVFTTEGLTAGVLSLKGRLTAKSLISFFSNKMPVDGWQMINKFAGQRNMMLFQKQTRYCTITIDEGQLSTIVELWVAPSMAAASRGLRK
jgi:uncharacterized membrane protein YgdD (TMEM256/DUF423 family)